jgi:UDP-glucose-4-epimerase GalE
MKRVLATGGAGYIGAHVVRVLAERGYEVLILDDFRSSSPDRADGFACAQVALEDVGEVVRVFAHFRPHSVIHMAGSISVAESIADPASYWDNNLRAASSLLIAASRHRLRRFVFSSTAAVYGSCATSPIAESAICSPTSPYGESKLAFEQLLRASARSLGFTAVALRYFNACGCAPEWGVGEAHEPEEHLIPRVLHWLQAGQPIRVYGNDYPTPDGTCVRDYVHVLDLATAHCAALEAHLPSASTFNVGTGKGYSVLEVIRTAARILEVRPEIRFEERRAGDPPSLVADASALRRVTAWAPVHSDLDEIVSSALAWLQTRGGGGSVLRHRAPSGASPSGAWE